MSDLLLFSCIYSSLRANCTVLFNFFNIFIGQSRLSISKLLIFCISCGSKWMSLTFFDASKNVRDLVWWFHIFTIKSIKIEEVYNLCKKCQFLSDRRASVSCSHRVLLSRGKKHDFTCSSAILHFTLLELQILLEEDEVSVFSFFLSFFAYKFPHLTLQRN
jgi:hypothetical protein